MIEWRRRRKAQRVNILTLNVGNLERPPVYPGSEKRGDLGNSIVVGLIRNNTSILHESSNVSEAAMKKREGARLLQLVSN